MLKNFLSLTFFYKITSHLKFFSFSLIFFIFACIYLSVTSNTFADAISVSSNEYLWDITGKNPPTPPPGISCISSGSDRYCKLPPNADIFPNSIGIKLDFSFPSGALANIDMSQGTFGIVFVPPSPATSCSSSDVNCLVGGQTFPQTQTSSLIMSSPSNENAYDGNNANFYKDNFGYFLQNYSNTASTINLAVRTQTRNDRDTSSGNGMWSYYLIFFHETPNYIVGQPDLTQDRPTILSSGSFTVGTENGDLSCGGPPTLTVTNIPSSNNNIYLIGASPIKTINVKLDNICSSKRYKVYLADGSDSSKPIATFFDGKLSDQHPSNNNTSPLTGSNAPYENLKNNNNTWTFDIPLLSGSDVYTTAIICMTQSDSSSTPNCSRSFGINDTTTGVSPPAELTQTPGGIAYWKTENSNTGFYQPCPFIKPSNVKPNSVTQYHFSSASNTSLFASLWSSFAANATFFFTGTFPSTNTLKTSSNQQFTYDPNMTSPPVSVQTTPEFLLVNPSQPPPSNNGTSTILNADPSRLNYMKDNLTVNFVAPKADQNYILNATTYSAKTNQQVSLITYESITTCKTANSICTYTVPVSHFNNTDISPSGQSVTISVSNTNIPTFNLATVITAYGPNVCHYGNVKCYNGQVCEDRGFPPFVSSACANPPPPISTPTPTLTAMQQCEETGASPDSCATKIGNTTTCNDGHACPYPNICLPGFIDIGNHGKTFDQHATCGSPHDCYDNCYQTSSGTPQENANHCAAYCNIGNACYALGPGESGGEGGGSCVYKQSDGTCHLGKCVNGSSSCNDLGGDCGFVPGCSGTTIDCKLATSFPNGLAPTAIVPTPYGYTPCIFVNTALGPIETNPFRFIQKAFGILLSLSGGIALLLIIYHGYRLIISQGNPEAIKKAREGITSGIIGIIFAILSIAILQTIGVDILHLPGFGS